MQASDVTALNTILEYLQSSNFELFLNQTFPGLYPEDDIPGLLELMTSKQPGKSKMFCNTYMNFLYFNFFGLSFQK